MLVTTCIVTTSPGQVKQGAALRRHVESLPKWPPQGFHQIPLAVGALDFWTACR